MAKILLIDDEPDLLELSQLTLESAGHEVQTLTQGARAVAVAADLCPQMIGLDWVIPDLSGEEVLRQLKARPDTRRIPVLVMSALDNLDRQVRRLGAVGVLAKPFGARSLIDTVAGVLAGGLRGHDAESTCAHARR